MERTHSLLEGATDASVVNYFPITLKKWYLQDHENLLDVI